MADEQPIDGLVDEPSALERFFTFISRPYYVATSLAGGVGEAIGRGDPSAIGRGIVDAAENTAMLAEELYTGSWAHGKHLTNLLPGVNSPNGLTERNERPELNDVLHRANLPFAAKKGSAAELGVNVLGGALLDPLTYVGGLGLGSKAGRVVKGAATGLGAATAAGEVAASTVARAVAESAPRAWAARVAAHGDDTTRAALSFFEEAVNTAEVRQVASRRAVEETSSLLREPGFEELARQRLGPVADVLDEQGYQQALRSLAQSEAESRLGILNDGRIALTGTAYQADLLDAGARWLESQRLLKPAGVPTFELAGQWRALPGTADDWAKIGLASPLHAAAGAAGVIDPRLPEALRAGAAGLAEKASRMFYDPTAGLLSEGIRAVGRQAAGEIFARQADRVKEVADIFGQAPPALVDEMGKEWLAVSDKFGSLTSGRWAEGATRSLRDELIQRFDQAGLDEATARAEAWRRLPWASAQETGLTDLEAEALRLLYLDRRQAIGTMAATKGFDPELAVRVLDRYVDAVRKLPEELVAAGKWTKAQATPFYVPHQAGEVMSRFLPDWRSAFDKSRQYTNLADWSAELEKQARKFGVDGMVGQPIETDLSKLLLRRLWSHERTMGQFRLEEAVKAQFPGARYASTVEQFLDAQLRPLGPRENALGKLLGGGDFTVTGQAAEVAGKLQPWLGGVAVGNQADNTVAWRYKWPGINAIQKPLLYLGALPLPAISTYVRNGVGGVVNGLLDPSIGWAGATGIATSLRDLPIVKALVGAPGLNQADLGLALRALKSRAPGAAPLTQAELGALQRARVGKYSLADLIDHMRAGVIRPRSFADRELFEQIGDVPKFAEVISQQGGWDHFKRALRGEFSSSTSERLLQSFRAYMEPLAAVNDAIEDGLRGGSFLALVRKGYDPASAAKRVSEQFVDYGYVSATERAVRDLFPFARFQIGITPVAVKGTVSAPGRMVGRAVSTPDDQTPLPPDIRGQTTIPWPGGPDAEGRQRFVTSLGLPFESAAQTLGLLQPSTQTIEKQAAALNPWVKTPIELALGRDFFAGGPIGLEDRGRDWLPGWLPGVKVETTPTGQVVKRVPPFVAHALVGFLPISRLNSEMDKWVKTFKGDYSQLVNSMTGIKLRSLDAEREAEKLIKRVLAEAVKDGDVGVVENFFVKGDKDDPAKAKLVQAVQALHEAQRNKRAR